MRITDKLNALTLPQKIILTVATVSSSYILFEYGPIMLPLLLLSVPIPTYLLMKIWGRRKRSFEEGRKEKKKEELKEEKRGGPETTWYTVGLIAIFIILLATLITTPARWRLQKPLEASKSSISRLASDIDKLCDNNCKQPYPTSIEELSVSTLITRNSTYDLSTKESCIKACSDRKGLKLSAAFTYFYKNYPHLKNKYYYYSFMFNCLSGLGGCPPEFWREEAGL